MLAKEESTKMKTLPIKTATRLSNWGILLCFGMRFWGFWAVGRLEKYSKSTITDVTK